MSIWTKRKHNLNRVFAVLGLVLTCGAGAAQTILPDPVESGVIEMGSQDGLEEWLAGFRVRALEAGIPAAVFDAALRGVEFNPKVVERDRRQK